MNLCVQESFVPGSVQKRADVGGVTGMEFLNKIFFISDGIMLSQVREISGVDGSTLQNWVKRGWIANTVNKRYSKDQLSHILIINMLRDSMMLERIDFLLRYINGSVNTKEDDIIPESQLYDYICTILDRVSTMENCTGEQLHACILECTQGYQDVLPGASERLHKALEIIVIAYYASYMQSFCNRLFEQL